MKAEQRELHSGLIIPHAACLLIMVGLGHSSNSASKSGNTLNLTNKTSFAKKRFAAFCRGTTALHSRAPLSRLQLVQDAAARLLAGTQARPDLAFPVLLHQLPVYGRINFKGLTLAYKCLHPFLTYCSPVSPQISRPAASGWTRLDFMGKKLFQLRRPNFKY